MWRFGGGYNSTPSIFDGITPDDLIIAFFPCVRFEDQIVMWFQGNGLAQRNWSDQQKVEYAIKLHAELSANYELWAKLVAVCLRRGFRLILENPNTPMHYMKRYFPIKPRIVDNDRAANGDYFKKATQYWFINCEPEQGFVFEPLESVARGNIVSTQQRGDIPREIFRSMIHPQYASRFIRTYILEDNSKC